LGKTGLGNQVWYKYHLGSHLQIIHLLLNKYVHVLNDLCKVDGFARLTSGLDEIVVGGYQQDKLIHFDGNSWISVLSWPFGLNSFG